VLVSVTWSVLPPAVGPGAVIIDPALAVVTWTPLSATVTVGGVAAPLDACLTLIRRPAFAVSVSLEPAMVVRLLRAPALTITLGARMYGTGNQWALSKGNPLPISLTVSSDHGNTVTGLTITGFIATAIGGEPIAVPDTAFTLVEDPVSPATLRRYKVSVLPAVVDALVGLGQPQLAVAIRRPDGFLVWVTIPVITDRVLR
jgi:hypothetical protein